MTPGLFITGLVLVLLGASACVLTGAVAGAYLFHRGRTGKSPIPDFHRKQEQPQPTPGLRQNLPKVGI